jgi:hypothetical protein
VFGTAFARKISHPNAFSARNQKLQYISSVLLWFFHHNFVEMERGSKRSIYSKISYLANRTSLNLPSFFSYSKKSTNDMWESEGSLLVKACLNYLIYLRLCTGISTFETIWESSPKQFMTCS